MLEVDFNPIHPAKDRSRTVPQSAQGRGSPRLSDKSMPASMDLHALLTPQAGYLEGNTPTPCEPFCFGFSVTCLCNGVSQRQV